MRTSIKAKTFAVTCRVVHMHKLYWCTNKPCMYARDILVFMHRQVSISFCYMKVSYFGKKPKQKPEQPIVVWSPKPKCPWFSTCFRFPHWIYRIYKSWGIAARLVYKTKCYTSTHLIEIKLFTFVYTSFESITTGLKIKL